MAGDVEEVASDLPPCHPPSLARQFLLEQSRKVIQVVISRFLALFIATIVFSSFLFVVIIILVIFVRIVLVVFVAKRGSDPRPSCSSIGARFPR